MWCARLVRDPKEPPTMKTFTIDDENNITVYATRKAAEANTGIAFTAADNLAELLGGDSKRLITIYNSLTGVTPVKKFTSNAVASKRILAELDKLEPIPCQTAPGAPQSPDVAPEKAPAKTKATSKKKAPKAAKQAEQAGPREGSKTSKVIDLLRREGGATLTEIMKKMGWQQHTTRALMSAGGSLAKKHGLTVVSTKGENGERTYSLPA
jgi:Protein of unknown function (DUF3489)